MMSPVVRWLDRAASEFPDRTALVIEGEPFSYKALDGAVSRMASGLWAAGVRPGAVVAGIGLSARTASFLVHALPRVGCAFLPLDGRMPTARLCGLLAQCATDRTILGPGAVLPEGMKMIPEHEIVGTGSFAPKDRKPLAEEDVHLIVATSGSSGDPKGVMLTGGNIAASAIVSRWRIPLAAADRWLACLPLFHVGGMSILYRMAEAGGTALVQEEFDAEEVVRAISEDGVTHVSLVPAMLAQILDMTVDEPPPPSLKVALVGGAALSEPLAHRAVAAGWPIFATYGMSETASQLATKGPLGKDWTQGDVGAPLDGFDVSLQESVLGMGRLRVRGPAVMAGYANPHRRTGEGIDDGWLITGDLVRWDGETLTVIGRADDVLVSGGENVHPAQIEAVLAKCPGVDSVCVIGQPDPVWGQVAVAMVTGSWAEAKVLEWGRENLQGAYRPRVVRRVTAMPLLNTGKPDRIAVRKMISEPSGA